MARARFFVALTIAMLALALPACSDVEVTSGEAVSHSEPAAADVVDTGRSAVQCPRDGDAGLPEIHAAGAGDDGRGHDDSDPDPGGLRPSEPSPDIARPEPAPTPERSDEPTPTEYALEQAAQHSPDQIVEVSVSVDAEDPCRISLAGLSPAARAEEIARREAQFEPYMTELGEWVEARGGVLVSWLWLSPLAFLELPAGMVEELSRHPLVVEVYWPVDVHSE